MCRPARLSMHPSSRDAPVPRLACRPTTAACSVRPGRPSCGLPMRVVHSMSLAARAGTWPTGTAPCACLRASLRQSRRWSCGAQGKGWLRDHARIASAISPLVMPPLAFSRTIHRNRDTFSLDTARTRKLPSSSTCRRCPCIRDAPTGGTGAVLPTHTVISTAGHSGLLSPLSGPALFPSPAAVLAPLGPCPVPRSVPRVGPVGAARGPTAPAPDRGE